jgi:transcriptional regulator with XRE-family HTH domain/Zn-dependent peptidase ImmA (M78 family)
MPVAVPVPVSAAVLVWARQESGYSAEQVAKRLGVKPERLTEWEQEGSQPTMRQIEALAAFYHRPLSLFFQPKPPALAPLAAEYRRLPGIVPGHESPELRFAVRKMSARRETMLQLLVELGESTPVFDLIAQLSESPPSVAERLRAALAVSPGEQLDWANEWQAWAAWRAAVERIGVLVFQFPKVPLAEARGLSLLRTPLPVAAVNPKEIPESRAFTLIHEVVHLMLAAGKEEAPAAKEGRDNDAWAAVERFAEETASHTLVPESSLAQEIRSGEFPRNGWDIGDVRSLARRFKITPLAMATRLRASGYFDWEHYQSWKRGWESWVAGLRPKSGGFAHPVDLTLGRAGRPFTQTVLEALSANRITVVNAAHYLDLKAEHFDKLKGALLSRPGAGGDDE